MLVKILRLRHFSLNTALQKMLTEILNAIILFGGGLALLLAVVQLFHERSRIKNILLFVIFLSLGIIHIYEYVISVTPDYSSTAALNILLLAKFLLGPSMYILYLAVFNRNYSFMLSGIPHFLPGGGILVLVVFMTASSGAGAGFILSVREYIYGSSILEYLHSLGFALIFVYTGAILMNIEAFSVLKNGKSDRLTIVGATVTVLLFVVIILIIAGLATGITFFSRVSLTLTTLFFIYWFVIVQIHPELFSSSIKKRKIQARSYDPLSGMDISVLENRLEELMNGEKIFCDEDLSIKRVADMLSIQPSQFSLYLNHRLGINFSTYINRYRVEEAIDMMKDDRRRSLLSIAFAVGFNSKSVFYDAFTKQTGLSPAKYRKQFFPSQKS
jgi:AraC-like DNA-binding protein